MLSRRNFFVILIMFLVVFIMFMLVDLSTAYFTRHESNPQASVPITITSDHAFTMDGLKLPVPDLGELAAQAARPQTGTADAQNAPAAIENDATIIAIIASDAASADVANMQEWCLYNRFYYQVYTELPEAEQLAACRMLLFADPVSDLADLPRLQAYADMGLDMVFTRLPVYQELQAAPELADFYGISGFVQEALPLNGLYIFDEFFIGGERIYALEDIYGDKDEDIPQTVPYYKLRPGYLMFVQAIAQDESINYMDLPALLWRTCSGKANVFVFNTDIFAGKNLPGVLTACMAQLEPFYVYPVVNAQTISMVDFPMLSVENSDTMAALYSRDSEALSRDVLWPAVVKILKNYGSAFNFFMAPQLDYSDENLPSGEMIDFYRQEIETQSGMLGLSMQQQSEASLATLCAENAAFLTEHMPEYQFTAACVTREQLDELTGSDLPAPLSSATLLMTDLAEDQPLMEFVNDRTVAVSFTTDGFIHESMDDLRLLCIENALGMNNQKVEMGQAIYPVDGADWNTLNLWWSRGDTYQKPYRFFDTVTVYGMEERVRTFLAVDYAAAFAEDAIVLDVTNGVKNASFVLRLFNYEIERVEGGKCRQISDSAYLLQPGDGRMTLHVKRLHQLTDTPTTYQEVISK